MKNSYFKAREVWVENMDNVEEEKRGLVDLHPKIFGTIPRLDLIFENVKWQTLYRKVVSVENRCDNYFLVNSFLFNNQF